MTISYILSLENSNTINISLRSENKLLIDALILIEGSGSGYGNFQNLNTSILSGSIYNKVNTISNTNNKGITYGTTFGINNTVSGSNYSVPSHIPINIPISINYNSFSNLGMNTNNGINYNSFNQLDINIPSGSNYSNFNNLGMNINNGINYSSFINLRTNISSGITYTTSNTLETFIPKYYPKKSFSIFISLGDINPKGKQYNLDTIPKKDIFHYIKKYDITGVERCQIEPCKNRSFENGLCRRHYKYWKSDMLKFEGLRSGRKSVLNITESFIFSKPKEHYRNTLKENR